MDKRSTRKVGVLALLFAAVLVGCDQLAVTGVDQLQPSAASASKKPKIGPIGLDPGDDTLEPLDFGLAWP